MKITYDPEVDALYIRFQETTVTTMHLAEGIAADYDADGRLAGIEVLEGNLMVRKSHFPNRFAVPLTTPFDPNASWFRKILDAQPR